MPRRSTSHQSESGTTVDEEIRRVEAEIAQRDLVTFCEFTSDGRWERTAHLEYIASLLMEAEAYVASEKHGTPYLLAIFVPRRHGKSELCSRYFPAWVLGRNNDCEIIQASYSGDLALDMSRDARSVYLRAAPVYGWPEISRESAAVSRWALKERRGKLQAAGVGGVITGRGANIAIIDDPVKGLEDGESLFAQRRAWDWYRGVLRPCLAPNAAIILVMTRWHDGDLGGRIVREMEKGGEPWRVVTLPAFAEDHDPLGRAPGMPLWPQRFDAEALDAIRRGLGARLFSAEYQQNPKADVEGALWDRETMIDPYRGTIEIEQLAEIVVAIDPGDTDETGIVVCGRDENEHGWVIEDASDIYEPNEWGEKALDLLMRYKADRIVAEENFGYKLVRANVEASAITWEGEEVRGTSVEVDMVNASRGKFQRADPVANLYTQGRVHHLAGADFEKLEEEQTCWVGRGPKRSRWSPNRLDACVWGLTALLIDASGGSGIEVVDWE